jgi:hypothetical protein
MLHTPRCARRIALAVAVTLGSLLGSPEVSAQQQRPVPLLAVEGPLQETIIEVPPQNIDITSLALFVLPGGDVVETDFFSPTGRHWVLKGPATAALFGELRGQLTASRVGFQRDCSAPFSVFEASLDWRITWSGRPGRSNAFRVVTEDRDHSLPPCPNEVLTLVEEIFRFRFQFSGLPTTEFIFSGPH